MYATAISKRATAAIVTLFAALLLAPLIPAQSPQSQAPKAQLPTPQWQIAAGGKMKFDAASLKWNETGLVGGDPHYENIDLGGQESYVPTGGLLSVRNGAIFKLMAFAYKMSGNQFPSFFPQLPNWVYKRGFDIQARAPISNPTKDQMRLMVQDLLEERFKLAVHWETRQMPVFGLAPAKSGKLGPQVRIHSEQPPCVYMPGSNRANAALQVLDSPADRIPGGFPAICGQLVGLQPCPPAYTCRGARDLPLSVLAPSFLAYFVPSLGHPIVDKTGLAGTYDFFFDFVDGPVSESPEGAGPTLLEAIKQQLGLKLVPQTGPVDVLVIDHIEEPSPN